MLATLKTVLVEAVMPQTMKDADRKQQQALDKLYKTLDVEKSNKTVQQGDKVMEELLGGFGIDER